MNEWFIINQYAYANLAIQPINGSYYKVIEI